jgi:hypothetical protein
MLMVVYRGCHQMREIGEIELSIQDGTTEIEQLGELSPSRLVPKHPQN